jgi:hypothetical protein
MTSPADLALMRRILDETGVDQTVPTPSWSAYFDTLSEALAEWLVRHFPRLEGLASLPRRLGPAAAVVAVALVVAVLAAMAWMALRRRRQPPAATRPATAAHLRASRPSERDRQAWRHEIERRLAAGDVEGALEALWWWFARSVSAGPIDPSWTSHELLACSGRADLTPVAGALDRLLYGYERPDAGHLRRFLGRLEAALP